MSTSSCSGRVSVFVEGRAKELGKQGKDGRGGGMRRVPVPVGGKGRGGGWLFVRHEDEVIEGGWEGVRDALGVGEGDVGDEGEGDGRMTVERMRLVRLQFEPMVCRLFIYSFSDHYIVQR